MSIINLVLKLSKLVLSSTAFSVKLIAALNDAFEIVGDDFELSLRILILVIRSHRNLASFFELTFHLLSCLLVLEGLLLSDTFAFFIFVVGLLDGGDLLQVFVESKAASACFFFQKGNSSLELIC